MSRVHLYHKHNAPMVGAGFRIPKGSHLRGDKWQSGMSEGHGLSHEYKRKKTRPFGTRSTPTIKGGSTKGTVDGKNIVATDHLTTQETQPFWAIDEGTNQHSVFGSGSGKKKKGKGFYL